ncbi:MAG: YncE family protein [Marmoricola sp.]|nr:YncE family protein [Marmoricola sp.]
MAALLLASACSSQSPKAPVADPTTAQTTPAHAAAPAVPWQFQNPLPGMPPVIGDNIYSQAGAGMMRADVAGDPAYLYVPDSTGSTVTVIDQRTRQIVRVLHAGMLSQHVVPAYDLSKFYVTSSVSNELVAISPHTGRITRAKSVPRPYNLYFTPDGRAAIVMVEQYNIIRFSNPRTFTSIADVSSPGCRGPNHADFSANGQFFVVTCEFSGELLKIATRSHRVLGHLKLARPMHGMAGMGASMPQDIRLSPDGTTFYVADMGTDQLRLISAKTFRQIKAIPMPSHPHGIYPSRDGRYFYVSDRGAGEVSVVDPAKRRIVATWKIPGGGSPDMGGVSADGTMLWLSGRYNGVVYGFNTRTGKLVAKIYVGGSPHGLLVWPQPGRYSLGHTGNMR